MPGQQRASERNPSYTSWFEEEWEVSCTQETLWRAWHSEFQGRVALAYRAELSLPRQDWEISYQEGRSLPRASESSKFIQGYGFPQNTEPFRQTYHDKCAEIRKCTS